MQVSLCVGNPTSPIKGKGMLVRSVLLSSLLVTLMSTPLPAQERTFTAIQDRMMRMTEQNAATVLLKYHEELGLSEQQKERLGVLDEGAQDRGQGLLSELSGSTGASAEAARDPAEERDRMIAHLDAMKELDRDLQALRREARALLTPTQEARLRALMRGGSGDFGPASGGWQDW